MKAYEKIINFYNTDRLFDAMIEYTRNEIPGKYSELVMNLPIEIEVAILRYRESLRDENQ